MYELKTKAIFWDNDGVLVDTERLYFQANAEALESENFVLTPDLFRQHWLTDSQGLNIIAKEFAWPLAKLEERRSWRNERYAELLSSGELVMPGVRETLMAIPNEIVQGIVTSSRRDHFNIIHARTNLLPFFAFVIAEGDYQFSKPAPDPYLAALALTQLKPEQCMVIEDSERGLRAARAAGIRCLIFENPLNSGADLSRAHGILKNIGQLLDFIS